MCRPFGSAGNLKMKYLLFLLCIIADIALCDIYSAEIYYESNPEAVAYQVRYGIDSFDSPSTVVLDVKDPLTIKIGSLDVLPISIFFTVAAINDQSVIGYESAIYEHKYTNNNGRLRVDIKCDNCDVTIHNETCPTQY